MEGRPLRNKSTLVVLKVLLEDVICKNGNVRPIVADHEELDLNEARMFFERFGI